MKNSITSAICSIHSMLYSGIHYKRIPLLRTSTRKEKQTKIAAFFADERGLNTVELVVIIAIVIGLALMFRKSITGYVDTLLTGIFSDATSEELLADLKTK